ncbi:MAG: oligopeptide:H+ symporter [Bacteroidota bacterium]
MDSTNKDGFLGQLEEQGIFGHKAGLFVLFFTEMWERFSYYGMRALLVLFLTASLLDEGWGWSRENALVLYGWYTGLVYLTPIIGGWIADKFLGYRNAVVVGAFVMTLGHAFMAVETPAFFYLGLLSLILGNGLFKPNISSIVGQLYTKDPEKKDGAYTIFYMGINAGAFLGILLCGYIGEKVGWSYGFGLAGIFMFFGMLQFYFAQKIFGNIGLKPTAANLAAAAENEEIEERDPPNVERDRIIVIGVFSFFVIFFWWAFEQAGGSMTIFAADYTDRVLSGGAATAFKLVNTILVVVPLIVITWVLLKLFRITFGKYSLSNIWLGLSFAIIWVIAIWLIQNDWNTKAYEVQYSDLNGNSKTTLIRTTEDLSDGSSIRLANDLVVAIYDEEKAEEDNLRIEDGYVLDEDGEQTAMTLMGTVVSVQKESKEGLWFGDENIGTFQIETASGSQEIKLNLDEDAAYSAGEQLRLTFNDGIDYIGDKEASTFTPATVIKQNTSEIEIAASWFGILNSFFIILLAPFFSRFWQSGIIKSGPVKFALGLILLGLGFAILAFGSAGIPQGAKVASVSIVWLILAYLFHTMGELCLSPVGLSYVSKLAPVRLVGLMFGIWFIANFVANLAAGLTGSYIDTIVETYSMSVFFLIFTIIPVGAGLLLIALNPRLKKMMHGIE